MAAGVDPPRFVSQSRGIGWQEPRRFDPEAIREIDHLTVAAFVEAIAGIAVHIDARVGALAGPSEVLVGSTVKDPVAGSGHAFVDRGEHELKGVPGSWRLYAVE